MALVIRLSMGSVTLCDWSSMCAGLKFGALRQLRLDQLVEHQEQPERIDRAGVEVVVAVLGIVEVEAAEAPRVHQARHDHFDVDVGRVVAEVDQAERLRARAPAPP